MPIYAAYKRILTSLSFFYETGNNNNEVKYPDDPSSFIHLYLYIKKVTLQTVSGVLVKWPGKGSQISFR